MTEISALAAHPRNYNRHSAGQVADLARSLTRFGQRKPVVTWRGVILAGHGLVEAARSLGWTEIWTAEAPEEWTEAEALAFVAADNELARAADPDVDALAALVAELGDVDAELARLAAGGEEALKRLLASIQQPAGDDPGAQVDKAEELRVKWGVETGQLWALGEHRLICGDCTDAAVVERLMGGDKAALLVTSPPYGVGKEYESGGIEEWRRLVNRSFDAATDCPLWFVNLNDRKTGNDGYEAHTFGLMVSDFENKGYRLLSLRVWAKDAAWAGQNPYWRQTYKAVDDFEFLGLFAQDKPKHSDRLTDEENKEWGYRGVWSIASVRENKVHSAGFPVELPERAIKMLTDAGAIVYEPFSGSGTTLIACERLGRRCRAAEISPGYVAVALERWSVMTGRTPVLAGGVDG